MSRKLIASAVAATAFIGLATLAQPVFAAEEFNVVPGLTYAGAPLGLHGADPVALVKTGNVADGSSQFTGTHDGVAYYFTSQANLDAFKANPAGFAPQNGGFCTYGVSVSKKFDGSPRYAAVEGGKLYVFLNKDIYEAFKKDKAGTLAKADAAWPKIQHKAAKEL